MKPGVSATPPRVEGTGGGTILAGSVNLVGTALYARAGELGLVAIVSPVSALFPLGPVLGGYLLFGERLDRLQTVGIVVIIGGLVLLR